jgi:membrane-bound ClpP family serine protease
MHRTTIRVILECATTWCRPHRKRECIVIILGVILLVVGYLVGVPILTTIGIILVVIGAVLYVLGATGRAVGGRAHYW